MLVVKVLDQNIIDKNRYSLNGVIISRTTDKIVNNLIIRNIGGKEITIDGNKIISYKQNILLSPIEKPKVKSLFVENDNIGVIDI